MRDRVAEGWRPPLMATQHGSEVEVRDKHERGSEDASRQGPSLAEPSPDKCCTKHQLPKYPFGLSSQTVYQGGEPDGQDTGQQQQQFERKDREECFLMQQGSNIHSSSIQHRLRTGDLTEQVKSQLGMVEGAVVMRQSLDGSQGPPSLEAFYTAGSCQLKDLPNPCKRRSHKSFPARKLPSHDRRGLKGCNNYLIQLKHKYKTVMEGVGRDDILSRKFVKMSHRMSDPRQPVGLTAHLQGEVASRENPLSSGPLIQLGSEPPSQKWHSEPLCIASLTEANNVQAQSSQQYRNLPMMPLPDRHTGDYRYRITQKYRPEMAAPEPSGGDHDLQLSSMHGGHHVPGHNFRDVPLHDISDDLRHGCEKTGFQRKSHRDQNISSIYATSAHHNEAPTLTTWSQYQNMNDSKTLSWHHLYTSPAKATEAPLIYDQENWHDQGKAQSPSMFGLDMQEKMLARHLVTKSDDLSSRKTLQNWLPHSVPGYRTLKVPYGNEEEEEETDPRRIPVPNVPIHFHDDVSAGHRGKQAVDGGSQSFVASQYADPSVIVHPANSLPPRGSYRKETLVVIKYSEADQKSPSTPLLFSQSPLSEE